MEGNDRRGREARQHHDRTAAVTATHKGLPGLSATPWITTPGSFSRPTA